MRGKGMEKERESAREHDEITVAGQTTRERRRRGRRSAGCRRRRRLPNLISPVGSVLGGASVSQPTLRDAVIISIVCLPFSGGGEGSFPPHSCSRVTTLPLPPFVSLSSVLHPSLAPRHSTVCPSGLSVRLLPAPIDADPLTHRGAAQACPLVPQSAS